jgi:Protein of unknown function (DUF4235)
MSFAAKVGYRALGTVAGAGAGLLAGILFKQLWRALSGDDDTPDAVDEERGWTEILFAAALQGAIFGLVKAAVDRGSAEAVRHTTGDWPA